MKVFEKLVWKSQVWIIVFVIGMVVFTFLDLPIAKEVYRFDSAYGRVFEIVGLFTTPMVGIFFVISNFYTIRLAKKRILSLVLGWLALIAFIGINGLSIYMLNKEWFGNMIMIYVLFIILARWAVQYICSHAQVVELRKVMIVGLSAALMAVLGQTLIKYCFNRPRFIWLTDPDMQFNYWFVRYPIVHDSSFPSGHAAQSALSFILVMFRRFVPDFRTRKWDIIMWTVAIFITGSTMISRMLLGVHYATDVWAGAFLTLFTISWSNWFVEKVYSE